MAKENEIAAGDENEISVRMPCPHCGRVYMSLPNWIIRFVWKGLDRVKAAYHFPLRFFVRRDIQLCALGNRPK